MEDVLQCSAEDISKVREAFGKDEQSIKEDVEILKKWIKQQQHLPQSPAALDENFLERILLRNKFQIEKAKKKLDDYYTLRGMYREFFQECNTVIPSKQTTLQLPSPRLTPARERVIIIRLRDMDPEKFSYTDIVGYFSLLNEISTRNDYNTGEVVLLDLQGATLDHLKRIAFVEVAKALDLHVRAYSGRLRGFHMINAPSYVNVLVNILRLALPAKIFERVQVHTEPESLYKYIPKECLPREYGGGLAPLLELVEKWDAVFDSHRQFFDENYNNVSNEKLRIADLPPNAIFGVEGTFKALNLD